MNIKFDAIERNHTRTLSVVRCLTEGKTINVGKHTLGIGNDMSVGFIVETKGERDIWGLTTMDLRELDQLLNKYNINEIL